jgi:hypothetical protein
MLNLGLGMGLGDNGADAAVAGFGGAADGSAACTTTAVPQAIDAPTPIPNSNREHNFMDVHLPVRRGNLICYKRQAVSLKVHANWDGNPVK